MKPVVLAVAAVFALGSIGAPSWADDGDRILRFGAFYSEATDDLKEPGETLELDESTGFQAGVEFMVTDRIGVEPAIAFANHDVEVEPTTLPEFVLGEIDYLALTGSVNVHVLQDKSVDLYLGPTVGFVFWGDLETDLFGPTTEFDVDEDFTLGLNLGLDVPFGSGKWGFSAGLNYLLTEIDLEGGVVSSEALGVDPINLKLGVSYSF